MKTSGWATYENRLLVILFFTFGLVFFDRLALSFIFPFLAEDLQLTNTHLGILSSVLALAWAVSGLLLGAYTDRKGYRKQVLIISIIVFSVCSVLSGVAGGFLSMLVYRAVMGLAQGPILPLAQIFMIKASSPKRRGLNMGLLQGSSAGLLGAVVAPPIIVWLAVTFGWRAAFYLTIIPGLIVAALIWRYVHDVPVDAPAEATPPASDPPAPGVSEASGEPSSVPSVPEAPAASRWSVLRERNVWLGMLISCVFLTWFAIIISFAPIYLMEVKGYSAGTMSLVFSSLGLAWVIWGFVVPAVSDRVGRRPAMVAFSLLAVGCPLAFLYVESPVILGALLVLTYTGLGCFTLFMATIPAETVPSNVVATALGAIMGVGELVGGFVAPIAAGVAADYLGLTVVMWISAAGALLAAILSLGLRETAPLRVGARAAASTAKQ